MASPTILAFDTSGPYCAAALLMNGAVVASRHEDMQRGQAERLFPMLDEVLGDVGAVWEELDAIGVGVGPGNFTGIRIAVSAARGLALSLGKPAVGVSSFEVVRRLLNSEMGKVATLLPAPRDQVYVEFSDTEIATEPFLANLSDFVCHTYLEPPGVICNFEPLHAFETYQVRGTKIDCDATSADLKNLQTKIAGTIADLAARKLASGKPLNRPTPLYVRPADAAPSSTPPVKILP